MDWKSARNGFKAYLKLERSLSPNSVSAYMNDLKHLQDYLQEQEISLPPEELTSEILEEFVLAISASGVADTTQGRIISGVRAFYKYLLMEDVMDHDPTQLIEGPKLQRKLPDVLHYEEIQAILAEIDLSKPAGVRSRAMIEVLYGCGLRVSELIGLKLSNLHLEVGYIKVFGKGSKERLVPIGNDAIKYIKMYRDDIRVHIAPDKEAVDSLFLNQRGGQISRISVFNMVKDVVRKAGIDKKVSPHTFRHSFASHLVDGGASIRAVQEMLGHESITTTEIYTHLDMGYLRDTILRYHPGNQ